MLLLRRALALALAAVAAASSSARAPLRSIALATNADILTPDHRVAAVSSFDVTFDVAGQRLRLSLEPNHDIFVEGGQISFLAADGSLVRQEPIDRHQHKVYKGTAFVREGKTWQKVGWARVGIRRDGLSPLFEGTFAVKRDHWHVKLASSYKATRIAGDPDVQVRAEEDMVVFKDSDMGVIGERTELKKRSQELACTSDDLGFNTLPDHPVYASMRARDHLDGMSMRFENVFGKRQSMDTQPGGNGAGVNLVSTIGSTTGCPTTRKVALVGIAADCNYLTSFANNKTAAQQNIIEQINAASELFETSFNISLGLANLILTEAECPTSQQQSTPWNQACSANVNIQARLSLFSQWRGGQKDQYSHWTLLTTCNTGSAVGLAWLGQACTTGAQPNPGSDGTVAGANVVVRTNTEWQVIAHETGHTYGAVHDCTSSLCADADTVNSQQCCPLSSSKCDAGQRFIMNPSTADGITAFSPCSVGNVCSALSRNSVKSTCLTNNRDITTITGQRCGNGIVEGDEQCDCGGPEQCGKNACCDPKTCRFVNNAVCDDSNEDCCRNCQYASADTVCRPSVSDCDPSETCTGKDPYCPEDKTRDDGESCGDGLSCASGQCTSRNLQCRTVMSDYTQGNDTYACDERNCMLSCANPKFGRNVCYGLQQNFLDGTGCSGGGHCQNGQCKGGSVGKEITNWIDDHLALVIGIAAGVGGFILLCICCSCIRSCRRRSKQRAYAKQMANHPHMPPGSIPMSAHPPSAYGSRRHRGHAPSESHVPFVGGYGRGAGDIPQPPPMYNRGPVRYA